MGRTVIEGAMCPDGKQRTFILDNSRIEEMIEGRRKGFDSDRTIDGIDLLVMPGLCNSHTHASMSLLRGIGEDKELGPWLNEDIWPVEAKMGVEHLKAGMALACLEMVRSGTTLFNDMYFREGEVAGVVERIGIRAVLGEGFIDLFEEERREKQIKAVESSISMIRGLGCPRISASVAPHAVYTVSKEGFEWCASKAREMGLVLHTHLSETMSEVDDCIKDHGRTPAGLLESYGLLGDRTIAAHGVHLSDEDQDLVSRSSFSISHVPVSNMKLSVKGQLRYPRLIEGRIPVCLGTDGAASNNNLDMFQTMKVAGLLCKQNYGAASIGSGDLVRMATEAGYQALGIDGGKLAEGALADLILIDLRHPSMVPLNDTTSNLVYSCMSGAVVHSFVDGNMIMEGGEVNGQDRIIRDARASALDLFGGDDGG